MAENFRCELIHLTNKLVAQLVAIIIVDQRSPRESVVPVIRGDRGLLMCLVQNKQYPCLE